MKCEVAAALLACASSASAFQVNAPTMMAKGSGVAKGIRSVAQPRAAKFLKEPEPNTNPQGEWFVRGDSSLSTALPWVNKPNVADGNLVGDFGFDPLSLSKTFDVSWLRSAELKHGRVCMLAAVGFLAPELVQHPVGFEGFHFPPEFSQMNAIQAIESVPKFGVAQIVLACGLIEFATFSSNYNSAYTFDDGLSKLERDNISRGNTKFLAGGAKFVSKVNDFNEDVGLGQVDPATSLPGDLGFDPLGLASQGVNPDYALAEIKHARLAMIGVLGMGLQQFVDQSKGVLQQTIEWAQAQS